MTPGRPARRGSSPRVSEWGFPTCPRARTHLVPSELIEAFPAPPRGGVGRRSQHTGGRNGVLGLTVWGWGFLELGRQTGVGGGTLRAGHLAPTVKRAPGPLAVPACRGLNKSHTLGYPSKPRSDSSPQRPGLGCLGHWSHPRLDPQCCRVGMGVSSPRAVVGRTPKQVTVLVCVRLSLAGLPPLPLPGSGECLTPRGLDPSPSHPPAQNHQEPPATGRCHHHCWGAHRVTPCVCQCLWVCTCVRMRCRGARGCADVYVGRDVHTLTSSESPWAPSPPAARTPASCPQPTRLCGGRAPRSSTPWGP